MTKSTALENSRSPRSNAVTPLPLHGMEYLWGAGVFAVEVSLWAGTAAAGYHWGARVAGPIGGVGLAVATLLLIGACWGRWMAPKATRRLRVAPRVAAGVTMLCAVTAASLPILGVGVAIGCLAVAVGVFAIGQVRIDGKA
ncbi:YrdB family protein [Gordonia polyisoprenivorans]|uniref:YrdB family protein n=1 Tax=Gordonia polyisoprenivorans TaxID=84595 RepID=UPI001AD78DA1|nr:YrdB family protein [Gordonia polyisoprenivorans]QTI68860.1 YrdB family protein [Gordonia polyisoprenivorans]